MKKAGLILLFILLAIMFWKFDFNGFFLSIKQLPPLAFIVLLFIQLISQLLVNYQWCRIGKAMNKEHSFFKMLYVNARGMIIESITPGVKIGGEVTRALLLKSELNYSAGESATLVTIQKMVSFSSFLLINLFAFTHISSKLESFNSIIIKAIVYFFLIVLLGLVILFFAFTSWIEDKITNTRPKYKWNKALKRYMLILLSNIKLLKNIKGEIYKQFFLSLLIWLLFPLKMILLVHLFTSNYDPIFLAEVTFISYMVGMIPLFPGGLGTFEATMTSLLMVMQIKANEALAITLLFRFITFWFVMLISLIYIGMWKVGERRWNQLN